MPENCYMEGGWGQRNHFWCQNCKNMTILWWKLDFKVWWEPNFMCTVSDGIFKLFLVKNLPIYCSKTLFLLCRNLVSWMLLQTSRKSLLLWKQYLTVFLLLQSSLASHLCIIICHAELLRNGYNALFQVQKICKFGLPNIWKQAKSRVEFHRQNLFNYLSSIYTKNTYAACISWVANLIK